MEVLSLKMKFLRFFCSPTLPFLTATQLFGEELAMSGTAQSLAAAETAFARESVEKECAPPFYLQISPTPQHGGRLISLPGPNPYDGGWWLRNSSI